MSARLIWLASFPKSGNTWTRAFLAQALSPKGQAPGLNTMRRFNAADNLQEHYDRAAGRPFVAASVEEWLAMRAKALRLVAGEGQGHRFVKTHSQVGCLQGHDLIPPALSAAAIYILRNPFDVAPSYARHLGVSLDEAIAKMADADAVNATRSQILDVVGRWDDHIDSWANAEGLPRHILRYEDLAADPEPPFRALLTFLGVRVSDGVLRRAIRASSFQALQRQEQAEGFIERPPHLKAFFAKGKAGAWRDDLSPAQIKTIRAAFLPAIERWYPELLDETAALA
ncbi:MAG: sulfotransferase domain-containing protein [Pseudomonadota bacterium]